jgi:coatomer subunit beta'
VYWSETGDLLTIVCEESFYVLKFDRQAYLQALESGQPIGEEGVDEAMELVTEITST